LGICDPASQRGSAGHTCCDFIRHAETRQDLLIMPLMDLAVRSRYPKDGDPTKGPIKLRSIDPAIGWVADNTTWQSGLTKICPATQFKGDLGHSSPQAMINPMAAVLHIPDPQATLSVVGRLGR
jgi:hypothetical protein